MSTEVFYLKQFSVRQSGVTWKVGFDGLLLGAWADVELATSIFDVGTGTGLIALMAAQRNLYAHVTGVEVDLRTASVAEANFNASPWSDRLTVLAQDIFSLEPTEGKYDLLISNPPFFPNGLKTRSRARSLARAGANFNAFGLPALCDKFLAENGRLNTILPYNIADDVLSRFEDYGFKPARKCDVRHTTEARFSRSLLELKRDADSVDSEVVTLYEGRIPSDRYIQLLKPFRDVT